MGDGLNEIGNLPEPPVLPDVEALSARIRARAWNSDPDADRLKMLTSSWEQMAALAGALRTAVYTDGARSIEVSPVQWTHLSNEFPSVIVGIQIEKPGNAPWTVSWNSDNDGLGVVLAELATKYAEVYRALLAQVLSIELIRGLNTLDQIAHVELQLTSLTTSIACGVLFRQNSTLYHVGERTPDTSVVQIDKSEPFLARLAEASGYSPTLIAERAAGIRLDDVLKKSDPDVTMESADEWRQAVGQVLAELITEAWNEIPPTETGSVVIMFVHVWEKLASQIDSSRYSIENHACLNDLLVRLISFYDTQNKLRGMYEDSGMRIRGADLESWKTVLQSAFGCDIAGLQAGPQSSPEV